MTRSSSPIVAAAVALQPLVREHAEAAERRAGPSPLVASAMANAGLFRMCAPAVVGGAEADPLTTIAAIEAIAAADGATGWVLMIGIETTGIGASYLSEAARESVFGDHRDAVIAGALNPVVRARRVDGGYVVDGRWPFASGCQIADWFWGQCTTDDDAGPVEVVVPRSDFTVIETWDSPGLRGSGSHDVCVEGVFVPDDRVTTTRVGRPSHDGPLFHVPQLSRLAYNKVGVATGITLAAIDHFVALATERTPRLAKGQLRERPRAQLAVAEAEAGLGGARAYCLDVVGDLWDTVVRGDRPTTRQRTLVRLACSHAVVSCARAVTGLFEAAGTAMADQSAPLGRCFRDIHTVGQHIMVAPHMIDDAGRVLLGLEPSTPAF